ncbi:MAG: hypothetical protein FP812_07025 [Desulfobacula sp.]|nr:hypothetical protein [Desulfobacula sp.]
MRNYKILILLTAFCLMGFGFWFAATGMTDDEHYSESYFEREDQHSTPFSEADNEGNETAGQIAALLLLIANLPVAVSILIKGINQYLPIGAGLKKILSNLNRIQKKYFMGFHYYLNLSILGIILWHWFASQCKSSFLPELGVIVMLISMILGFLIKFKLCPKFFRKSVYKIHTQPIVFISMFLVLTVGHLIVD